MSLSLNILLTLMIVGRIWAYQREGKATFGRDFGARYTSISTMFIESAAMYSIVSILFLGTYATGEPTNQIWFGISPSIQVSYIIIQPSIIGC